MKMNAPATQPKPGDQLGDEGWDENEEVENYRRQRETEAKELQGKQRLMSAVQGENNKLGRPQGGQGSGSDQNLGNSGGLHDDHGLENGRGFESDDQFQKYLQSLTEYDRSRYQQLLSKNKQLKEELRKIVKQTEELIIKEKEKKVHKPAVEENEEVQSRMKSLKQQQFHIANLKSRIAEKRAELDETQQYELVRQKEDELKDLKRKLKEMMDERNTVASLRDEQAKALEKLKGGEDQEQRKQALMEELRNFKQENKILMDKKTELEKELKKNHSKMFDGKIYIRELQKRIEQHKKRFLGGEMRSITDDDIELLRQKIKDLEEERKTKILTHEQDMQDIEYMKRQIERENDRLQRLLTEKDREMRINSLKMKELKRIQRTRATRPLKANLDMEDLQEEHELNKYLLHQERELRSRLDNLKTTVEKTSSQPVLKTKQPQFKEDQYPDVRPSNKLKPVERLDNLEDIDRKERQLIEQLEQLRKKKMQIGEFE